MTRKNQGVVGSMKVLCRQMEELRNTALIEKSLSQQVMPDDVKVRLADMFFDSSLFRISEGEIRHLCRNNEVFWRGVEYFMQGRVMVRDARLTKSGVEINAKVRGKSAPYYDVDIIFDKKGNLITGCDCPASARTMCKHVVAVLVCWSRKPRSFNLDVSRVVEMAPNESTIDQAFAERYRETLVRLEDIITRIHKSSKNEDFAVIQQVHTLMKMGIIDSDYAKKEIVEFVKLTSIASVSIIAALDAKYGFGAMSLYSRSTARIMGELVEMFIERTRTSSLPAEQPVIKEEKVRDDTAPKAGSEMPVGVTEKSGGSSGVSRSWDSILEEFAAKQG
ncbi:MAG: hypothetical protein QXU32_04695 [Nitrososphaerales archaeon]